MTRGVRQIVRFNWPFYAAASGAASMATVAGIVFRVPGAVRVFLFGSAGLAFFWLAGSLAASWVVYDRSRLMQWDWILAALGFRPRAWINMHAGLDESTPALRKLAGPHGRVFDFYDSVEMDEPSIARARRFARNAIEPERADFRHLPAPAESANAAFLLLSAHELRSEQARGALFGEVRRVLAPDGRVIVVEHLRDWANFAAFGPGFLHFHSRRTWQRSFDRARLAIDAEFPITPFVRVFVLRRFA